LVEVAVEEGEVEEEGEGEGEGVHHFRVRDWVRDMRTQAEMLASWSRDERMISEPGGKERARERLAKSWVVEGPITGVGMGGG